MTSNTLVSLNKIRRFHPKRDSENDVHPSLCPFRETKFLIFRDMKKNEMQTYTRVVREKERLLSLSLSLCEQKRIVRSASREAQKKRSQYVPLTRRNLLRIYVTRNQKFAQRERERSLGFWSKTLNKKKRPINLRTFPSRTLDFRLTLARKNTHHHEHESFTINRRATARGVIAPVSESAWAFLVRTRARESKRNAEIQFSQAGGGLTFTFTFAGKEKR